MRHSVDPRSVDRDVLTGLRSRVEILTHIDRDIGGVVFADLDGLSHLNDAVGHQIVDEVLRSIAIDLVAAMPPEPAAMVSRWGGDEFVIVVQDKWSVAELEQAAREVVGRERRVAIDTPGTLFQITLTTLGVASATRSDGVGPAQIEIVERRSRAAKTSDGRPQVVAVDDAGAGGASTGA